MATSGNSRRIRRSTVNISELCSRTPARRIHNHTPSNSISKRAEEPPRSKPRIPFDPASPRRGSRWRLPLQRLTTVVVSIRSARSETPNATESVRSNPHLSPKPRRRPPKTAKPCSGNRRYLYRRKSHLRAAVTIDLCVSNDRSLAQ